MRSQWKIVRRFRQVGLACDIYAKVQAIQR